MISGTVKGREEKLIIGSRKVNKFMSDKNVVKASTVVLKIGSIFMLNIITESS